MAALFVCLEEKVESGNGPLSPYIWSDIAQIATAVGVIATAISSIWNRAKLNQVEQKVDTAVAVASETRKEAVGAVQEVKKVVLAVKDATLAVNAEVVAKVHEQGVEAGKEIAHNGKS
jgi:hypothetical protein